MHLARVIGLVVMLGGLLLASSSKAGIIHTSSASVSGGTSHNESGDSPNSSTAGGILNNGFAFSRSDAYAVNGWVNDGSAVKSASSIYEEVLTTTEFNNRYGAFPGGGTLDVVVAYRLSLVGNAINGGGIRLRVEKLGGGIVDDNFTTLSPVSQSGTLHVQQATCCTPNGVRIRLTGDVSVGGNSFGTYAASITEIRYNGEVVFVGPPPAPEPSAVCLALLGLAGMPLLGWRGRLTA